ncbi:VPLPA-CTERM sorting domain-containing protein [Oceanicoccus sagamiensis]|uniref:DUF1566 domain-containing protein n=1 Tax=Oceanicoccus sagamiensis TaxID=716816 RepID=A0A1X9ND86_9GAMM|nr:VPLPA-CTERM sorting domain-containing protein [Oceanicoccus sagamiensis]ARN72917.1 hypothetical protein BST96_01630 [Oceanicoccus sagamiensis]
MFNYTLALVGLSLSVFANAALYDRGNGLLYDDELNITWLLDFNYAKTSGYHTTGYMTREDAKTWVEALDYGGYQGWRLPTQTNGAYGNSSYEIGELGHLYNFTLGNQRQDWNDPNDWCEEIEYDYYECGYDTAMENDSFTDPITGQTISFGLLAYESYKSFQYGDLREGSRDYHIQGFGFYDGAEFTANTQYGGGYLAWAVHDGDIAAVPVPGAVWLFGSALAGLAGFKRKK